MARSPATAAPPPAQATGSQVAEPSVSFEQALAELDRLVEQMEGGQLPLDRLLDAYRRGSELLGYCRQRLQVVEEQVKVLEDGQLKPWAHS
jgi:exodeoxyribonuclease VII small subunit